MADYLKCKDCKWLIGKRSSIGIECMQADNQEKWEHQTMLNQIAGKFYPEVTARYKAPSTKACKRYEPKLEQTDCSWK